MITRVYIDNFRSFVNFEVHPDRINLLIGHNGAGKSTFVEVLHSVVELTVMGHAAEEAFPSNTPTRWDSRKVQHVELDISGNGGAYEYVLEIEHDLVKQNVLLKREIVKFDSRILFVYEDDAVQLHNNEGKFSTRFPFRGTRSFLSQLEPRPENTLLQWFINSLSRVWLLKIDPTDIDSESQRESDTLDSDGSNFASWYRHLSQERPEDLPELFQRLGAIMPGFKTLKTIGTGKHGQRRELVAGFNYNGGRSNNYEIDFDDLSDGERDTIILYCILIDPDRRSRTLLLDEPENYVGLQLIQPWLVELADTIRDEGQLFLVSHHPEVIDYLASNETLFFERIDGGPTRIRKNPFDRDQGLKASELVARGLLDAE